MEYHINLLINYLILGIFIIEGQHLVYLRDNKFILIIPAAMFIIVALYILLFKSMIRYLIHL